LDPFKKGFDDLEIRFQNQKDKVQKWRDSMLKVGGFAGFVVKNNRYLSLLCVCMFVCFSHFFFFSFVIIDTDFSNSFEK
jgi:hypothetical protein